MPGPIAIVREVSPAMGECELSYLERTPIDIPRANEQHLSYCAALSNLGARLVVLPSTPDLPDSVFVEDTAVALDEVAVVAIPGAPSRRPEVISVAAVLNRYRLVEYLSGEATLDGGDVMHAGRRLVVGRTARTNGEGIDQLRAIVSPYGYEVVEASVDGCLHFKSACSYLGRNTVLVKASWTDLSDLAGFDVLEVAPSEPWAANTVVAGNIVLMSNACPETQAIVSARGFEVRGLDISEFEKAEGGLSCMSILLDARS